MGPQNQQSENVPGRPGAGPRLAVLGVEPLACSGAMFLHTGLAGDT